MYEKSNGNLRNEKEKSNVWLYIIFKLVFWGIRRKNKKGYNFTIKDWWIDTEKEIKFDLEIYNCVKYWNSSNLIKIYYSL